MIKRKSFIQFYYQSISKDNVEAIYAYKTFDAYIEAFMADFKCKQIEAVENSEYVELAYLYSAIWGYFAIAIFMNSEENNENETESLLLSTLSVTISNDILAIINLALNGLDYQACNILRNLYEIGLLLINVYIDKDKRKELIFSEDGIKTWHKNFRVSSMIETFALSSKSELVKKYLRTSYKDIYKNLSAFIHNDYLNFSLYSFSKPKNNNDTLKLNVSATYVTRHNDIIKDAVDILWTTTLRFRKLMEEDNYKEFTKSIFGKENNEFLCFSKNGCCYAQYQYIKLKNI